MERLKEKLRKVLAMAEGGTIHEKEVAKKKLNVLLAKHGLTMEDIADEETYLYDFSFNNKFERTLLVQILAMVTDSRQVRWTKYYKNSRTRGYRLTPMQNAEATMIYGILRKQLKTEMDILMGAFIHKHNLYPQSDTGEEGDSNMSREEAMKLFNMIAGLSDVVIPRGMIEEKGGQN